MGDPSLLSMTPEQSPVRELSGDRQDPPETSASFRAMRRLSFSEEPDTAADQASAAAVVTTNLGDTELVGLAPDAHAPSPEPMDFQI